MWAARNPLEKIAEDDYEHATPEQRKIRDMYNRAIDSLNYKAAGRVIGVFGGVGTAAALMDMNNNNPLRKRIRK